MNIDPDDITPDPIRITWIQSGYTVSGTLQEYADSWANRQYDGGDTGLSESVTYWPDEDAEPIKYLVHIVREATQHDEISDRVWIPYRFNLDIPGMPNGSIAITTVDGDA